MIKGKAHQCSILSLFNFHEHFSADAAFSPIFFFLLSHFLISRSGCTPLKQSCHARLGGLCSLEGSGLSPEGLFPTGALWCQTCWKGTQWKQLPACFLLTSLHSYTEEQKGTFIHKLHYIFTAGGLKHCNSILLALILNKSLLTVWFHRWNALPAWSGYMITPYCFFACQEFQGRGHLTPNRLKINFWLCIFQSISCRVDNHNTGLLSIYSEVCVCAVCCCVSADWINLLPHN